MLCQFEKLLYPKDIHAAGSGSYMVAVYRPCEIVRDSTGSILPQFKAVGYFLPLCDKLRYDFKGHWSKNPRHGTQFEVDSYDEIIIPSREGIIGYLSSGQIKGIGPRIAEKIFDAFGDMTLEVLDKEPEKLLSITGISQTRLNRISDSYLVNRAARDVVAFLTPYGITANRAVKLYREYGKDAMSIVKDHPYQLCELAGIGFKTADRIAASVGFSPLSTDRTDAALLYTLTEAESHGHLCMEKHAFIKECQKLLDTSELTEKMLANRAARLVESGDLVSYQGMVYRVSNAQSEAKLAAHIHRLLHTDCRYTYLDLDAEIDAEERALRVRFAPEQRDAVKMALTHSLSIITGGPGTGKTMIQRAILDIYKRSHPDNRIICCAPTGRAARRMEQSTGESASRSRPATTALWPRRGSIPAIRTRPIASLPRRPRLAAAARTSPPSPPGSGRRRQPSASRSAMRALAFSLPWPGRISAATLPMSSHWIWSPPEILQQLLMRSPLPMRRRLPRQHPQNRRRRKSSPRP